ncbi:L,D-transpeptidase family protein [Bradyrhizobium sp. SYSU BS000235]|uniref:L,D-transpeptidase n=1 Tax=Bradyrhizobium sp. SYSU BS000235 TaxID=3411332 RepID=UPI003C75D9A2
MFNRLSTVSAVVLAAFAASVAGSHVAVAQSYPPPPGYSEPVRPAPYGLPDAGGRGAPDFDRLNDDDARGQGSAALSPPGYQQPGPPQQAYQQRSLPPQDNMALGPVMSPDDPRYGRPMAPPQQTYSDRGPAPIYTEERAPQGNNYSDQDRGMRPPGAIDGRSAAMPPQGGQPATLSALPPDDQPETGPRQELEPRLRRQEVSFQTKEPPGTIIVDTPNTLLYYVLGGGRAIRYGVRVGRDGFTWTGVQKITRKAEWPDWHPPAEMIERQPYLPRFMAGGDGNPLGARAMYLGNTVYRIHGTNQPSTIGKFVSSGCIGMLNEDVTDLFDRVKVGTRVVVLPGGKPPEVTASAQPAAAPSPMANAEGAVGRAPVGVPNQGPTVVPPLPAPVTVR